MEKTVFERQQVAPTVIEQSLAQTAHSVFWLDDVDAPAYQPIASNSAYDLVIVGGGFCGLWTAVLAQERHPEYRIAILESQEIGWAASGRNGGFCEASLTHGYENGVSRWPEEIEALERLGLENLDEFERDIERLGIDCDFERTGSIAVATEPYQVDGLREGADGEGSVFLDADEVRKYVDSPTYLAGLRNDRENALIHPAKLAKELARVATERGVTVYEHSPVGQLKKEGDEIVLESNGYTVAASQVVLATNVFPSLLKRNRWHTVPVYDYVLMTEPLTAEQLASIGWVGRQGLADSANQFHYYRMTADNRILWGGYDAIYHYGRNVDERYESREESYTKLASHFFTTFPQLEGITFTHKWAGAIDTCTRFCAFFGTAHDNTVAYAAGFTGLGVGATRFAANVMLDQLDGLDTERTRLEMVRKKPLPFPPEPFATVGIQLARWSMDRADHNNGKRNLLLKTLDAMGLGFDS